MDHLGLPPSAPPPPPPPPPQLEPEPQLETKSEPTQPLIKKPKMSTTTSDEETATATEILRPPRYKRRKIAIFFAYCGVGYQGMQKNPGAKTIEGDFEEALYLSGAVPEADRGIPKRYDWARSARTDKGVSAVGQVVSGRFYIDPPGLVERLNQNLPQQIKVFGYKRVTASFNSKKFCDRRRYVYLVPVFALDERCHRDRESVFASKKEGDGELVKCVECSERGRKVAGLMGKRSYQLRGDLELGESEVVSSISANRRCVIDGKGDNEGNADGDRGSTDIDAESRGNDFCQSKGKEESLETVDDEDGDEKSNVDGEREFHLAGLSNGSPAVLKDGIDNSNGVEKFDRVENESCEGMNVGDDSYVRSGILNGSDDMVAVSVGNTEENGGMGSEFRYGEKEKERFNRILGNYVGTHNFHNFTTRTKAEDPSARRYIISFEANRVVSVGGIDFVKCEVVGQSFMLHQIRKMIGLAVAVMRNCAEESLISKALQKDVNVNVPTAPEVGLYLDECLFTSYNNKWRESHEGLSMKDYMEEAEEFKMKFIYSHIASTEQKEGVVALWLHSLNHRNYPDLCSGEGDDASGDKSTG